MYYFEYLHIYSIYDYIYVIKLFLFLALVASSTAATVLAGKDKREVYLPFQLPTPSHLSVEK